MNLDTVRATLEAQLPPATLILGPAKTGKWTLVRHLASHHRVPLVDQSTWPGGLRVTNVRALAEFADRAPHGPFRLVLARLDGSSAAAFQAMLKPIEEPPPTVRYLFTATVRPPATVMSRCTVYATAGHGTHATHDDPSRAAAVTVLRAVMAGDTVLFDTALRGFTEDSREALLQLLTECVTRRFTSFTEADASGAHLLPSLAARLLCAAATLPYARPRLALRACLAPFLPR